MKPTEPTWDSPFGGAGAGLGVTGGAEVGPGLGASAGMEAFMRPSRACDVTAFPCTKQKHKKATKKKKPESEGGVGVDPGGGFENPALIRVQV